MNQTAPYRFALAGAGWRAEFFFRIVAALPERFRVTGVVVRNPDKARQIERRWGHQTFRTIDELLDASDTLPEFVVSSVSYSANYEVNLGLVDTNLPLLSETPPAATVEQMVSLWEAVQKQGARMQVAEQFHRQPHHAARLEAVRRGKLGPVHTASVSVSHGYHGTSLLRHFLGVAFDEARILGAGWTDRVLDPGGREGPPAHPEVKALPQQIALLDFGNGKQAVFDFVGAQYFSPIRTQRITIRGERGEIVDHTFYGYNQNGEPVTLPFHRQVAGANGNLEGMHLKGIQLGDEWLYRNPTVPARLSDEEIAMADLLQRMGAYVRGGPEPYPLRDAMQDHYLGLCIRQACETGQPVVATRQVWSEPVP
jgi:predicted dehydrogenase